MHGGNEWIINSGAIHHIISKLDSLNRAKEISDNTSNQVQLPNGKTGGVLHICNTNVLSNHTISNVLYLPDFKVNLLISKVTKELQCMVSFFPYLYVF